ncbi:MAG: ATP-binding cassette domain-containing protein [Clostridiaceae bacterium]
MILIQNVKKSYFSNNNTVDALKNVTLKIDKGDVFGIIGYSGAGKSTLLRCINLLEKPSSGRVIINNQELTSLNEKSLRKCRKKIGMIFQHFNLMNNRNVFKNISYPLKGSGLNKDQLEEKVINLLRIVGLEDKLKAYPSQLSGGEKQRVAIARALANDPEVLLCDEATSALDPQNTKSILSLLKDINKKLNLTIVIITHQMEVVKEICNKVAIMEGGEVVEVGNTLNVFTSPKNSTTKEFVASIFKYENVLESYNSLNNEIIAKISYIGDTSGEALISKISIDFNIYVNILYGNIENIQGVPVGNLIVAFSGNEKKILESINYLNKNNVNVEVINYDKNSDGSNSQCNRTVS